MTSVKAGALRHRILLENRNVTSDALGGEIVTWVPIATLKGDGKVWGNVRFQSGMEALRTDAIVATRRASIQILFRSDLKPTARATYDGQVYDIKSVLPDPDTGRDYLFLACEGGASNG